LNFIKKEQGNTLIRDYFIQQGIIRKGKAGKAEIVKIEIKKVPAQVFYKLAQKGAFSAAPDTAYNQGVGFYIRQIRQHMAFKPCILGIQERFLS
jgi:hypothetical protein